jgi:hypothetical protein
MDFWANSILRKFWLVQFLLTIENWVCRDLYTLSENKNNVQFSARKKILIHLFHQFKPLGQLRIVFAGYNWDAKAQAYGETTRTVCTKIINLESAKRDFYVGRWRLGAYIDDMPEMRTANTFIYSEAGILALFSSPIFFFSFWTQTERRILSEPVGGTETFVGRGHFIKLALLLRCPSVNSW